MKKTQKSKEKTYKSGEVMSMLEQINDGVQVVAEDQGEIKNRMIRLETKFDNMQEDITEIKQRLSEKVDRDEFNKMEKRVIKLEKLVFAKLAR